MLSLPPDQDEFKSSILSSYRVNQGVCHNPASDRRTTKGVFHVTEDGLPIPADKHHIHFGDGSTTTEITLPPGEHTLQMLLGDHLHIPHDPPLVSEPLTITVE